MKLLILLMLCPVFLVAQEKTSAKLAAYMQAQADVNNFSGTVLVMKNGTIFEKKD